MKRTTEQMIEKSIQEGYELKVNGLGKYDALVNKYRAEGYDVRAWYVERGKDGNRFELYVKQKISRTRKAPKKVEIDYSTMTSKELKETCKNRKISQYYKMNKEQMINALSGRQSSLDAETRYEMEAAFGKGQTIVNVLTGEKYYL